MEADADFILHGVPKVCHGSISGRAHNSKHIPFQFKVNTLCSFGSVSLLETVPANKAAGPE